MLLSSPYLLLELLFFGFIEVQGAHTLDSPLQLLEFGISFSFVAHYGLVREMESPLKCAGADV